MTTFMTLLDIACGRPIPPHDSGRARRLQLVVFAFLASLLFAAAWGLANAALPAREVEARARAAAQALAQKPPESLRLTKSLMRDREALIARMRREGDLFAERLKSPEAMAAFSAFLQRRS